MFPTTTTSTLYAGIGTISGDILSGLLPYIYVFAGLFVGFWTIKKILGILIYEGDFGATIDHIIKPKYKGYKWYHSEKWNMENTA